MDYMDLFNFVVSLAAGFWLGTRRGGGPYLRALKMQREAESSLRESRYLLGIAEARLERAEELYTKVELRLADPERSDLPN